MRRLLIVPPILLGVAVLYYLASGDRALERKPPEELARTVRVIPAEPVRIVPRVTGFGSVYPRTVWRGIAQVSGEVTYVHPDLRKGAILPAGTQIIRISTDDYNLAINQASANIRSAQAKLAEIKVDESNTADLLAIEMRVLELRNAEFKRKQDLLQRNTISQSALDLEQRQVLAQRKQVQDLKNRLRLLPTRRAVQTEQIAVYQAQLESARLNLARTRIDLPFEARISEVNVEEKQFIQTGGLLVTADSIGVAEVEAQIPLAQLRAIVIASTPGQLAYGITSHSLAKMSETVGFEAFVRLSVGSDMIVWPARFERISDTIDPKTRTIGVIVAVEGAYAKASPGQRPPLTKGMFVEIEIRTKTLEKRIVAPRSALHGDKLYMAGANNRLEIRAVKTGLVQGNFAVITEGVNKGERIVISDLIPAVEGMLLVAKTDTVALARLKSDAAGRQSVP